MSLFDMFKNISSSNGKIPEFDSSKVIRRHYIFEGMVQGVGFRYTFHKVGNKLSLVGWVKNLTNGNVEAEVQGEENKIDYLIEFMNERSGIRIDDKKINEIDLVDGEKELSIKN